MEKKQQLQGASLQPSDAAAAVTRDQPRSIFSGKRLHLLREAQQKFGSKLIELDAEKKLAKAHGY